MAECLCRSCQEEVTRQIQIEICTTIVHLFGDDSEMQNRKSLNCFDMVTYPTTILKSVGVAASSMQWKIIHTKA
ncbi:hypothetical protein VQ7734_04383 [Vibrio quintilis]|uniref:Uncharacterized protein n=1 Tax=Vibrio quintilis TaxID=1117707 RepID=A0A1M7Z174_9VIBR|nr:hypothetical protein VQ7734_04383 [Vibrio quintilis]